jgi:hypothetical protein
MSSLYLHDHAGSPGDGVVVVVRGGVEPRLELHLLVADAVRVDVGVDGVGLPCLVPQELEVDLVVILTQRRRLHYYYFLKS